MSRLILIGFVFVITAVTTVVGIAVVAHANFQNDHCCLSNTSNCSGCIPVLAPGGGTAYINLHTNTINKCQPGYAGRLCFDNTPQACYSNPMATLYTAADCVTPTGMTKDYTLNFSPCTQYVGPCP